MSHPNTKVTDKPKRRSKSRRITIPNTVQCGVLISVTVNNNQPIEGVVYCCNTPLRTLIIELSPIGSKRSFTIISTDYIRAISVIDDVVRPVEPFSINEETIKAKEAKTAKDRKRLMASIGKNVSTTAQLLFDAFSKMYSCSWDSKTIVLMDTIRIGSPYTAECVSGPEGSLAHVRNMLDRFRLALPQEEVKQ